MVGGRECQRLHIGEPGAEIYVGGAANLVWDLHAAGPDGQPVGTGGTTVRPGFEPTTPGFFSSIVNGTGIYKLQPASFTWEFGDSSPMVVSRIRMLPMALNMLQFTYPSRTATTAMTRRREPTRSTAQVLAVPAPSWGWALATRNSIRARAVWSALAWVSGDGGGIYSCFQNIGEKAPIAEARSTWRPARTEHYYAGSDSGAGKQRHLERGPGLRVRYDRCVRDSSEDGNWAERCRSSAMRPLQRAR